MRKAFSFLCFFLSFCRLSAQQCLPLGALVSPGKNVSLQYLPRLPFSDPLVIPLKNNCEVGLTVEYSNGIGQVLQRINVKGSPSGRDIVQSLEYDDVGHLRKSYLPYVAVSAASNGSFKTSAVSDAGSFYSNPSSTTWNAPGVVQIAVANGISPVYNETRYEASALGRIEEQGFSGATWQLSSGHTNRAGFDLNVANEVRLWNAVATGASSPGYYGAGLLSKTITRDANWVSGKAGTVEDFTDIDGRVVLKRSWSDESTSLSTYYVYDELGNLRYVIPPGVSATSFIETDAAFLNFVYSYRYDGRKRVIEKKIPGKGWEYMVYNKLDQLVLSQDALQRSSNQWSFIKYDALGRVIMTGLYTHSDNSAQAALQTVVSSHGESNSLWESRSGSNYTNLSFPQTIGSYLTINYYDSYDFTGNVFGSPNTSLGQVSAEQTRGLLTGTSVAILGTGQMLLSVQYYDGKGRIVQLKSQHYKGGVVSAGNYDEISTTYKFTGEVESSTRRHYVGGVESLYVLNEYTYDHMGRQLDTRQKTGDNSATSNPMILLSRNSYNEIGQLRSKGLHATNLSTPSFAQTVTYNYNARGWLSSQAAPLFNQTLKYDEPVTGVTAQYNGNISRQEWGPAASPQLHNYKYSYDKLNRLNWAQSDEGKNELIGYDNMGNIGRLQRQSATSAIVDQLRYEYTGNRLSNVIDTNTNTVATYQLPGTTSYVYDANGNMISRINTTSAANNMYSMAYNHLNLPTNINANGAVITYTYDGAGTKLRKIVTGATNVNNEYINGINYEDGVIKFVRTAEGRILRGSATNYIYEYTLSDHLGNGRVYFEVSSSNVVTKKQELDYYAFGMEIERQISSPKNLYMYNGKEKQEQEKMFDYGARFYDPVIGRWNVIDPMAAVSEAYSPYQYVENNPLKYIDPTGMFKEYADADAYKAENPTGNLDGSDGHWLTQDRIDNTSVWNAANIYNLQGGYFNQYTTIDQRTSFYSWFQKTTEAQGQETMWAGAAAIVAGQMRQTESPGASLFISSNMYKFAQEGNKKIFNDVFGRLTTLYNGGVAGNLLTGDAAKKWDAQTLYKEQFTIIEPLYRKQSIATLDELSRMSKGQGFAGSLAFIFTPELKFKGDITNPQDRYNHGMNVIVPFYKKWGFSGGPGSAIRLPMN